MPTTISYEEWIAALSQASQPSADGQTISEWQAALAVSVAAARNWVRQGLAKGWLEAVRVVRTKLTGHQHSLVGFKLKEKSRGKASA